MNRPGDFLTVNLVLAVEDRERWPSDVSSLDQFRTAVFERALMRQMIEFGWFFVDDPKRPWVKQEFGPILSTWLLLVPKCYREKVTALALATFNRVLKNEIHKPHHRDLYVEELRDAVWRELEPVMPGGDR